MFYIIRVLFFFKIVRFKNLPSFKADTNRFGFLKTHKSKKSHSIKNIALAIPCEGNGHIIRAISLKKQVEKEPVNLENHF